MAPSIEEQASRVAKLLWGMARDLASPSLSGTSLNSERQTAKLTALIAALSQNIAREMIDHEAHVKVGALMADNKLLRAEIRQMNKERNAPKEKVA